MSGVEFKCTDLLGKKEKRKKQMITTACTFHEFSFEYMQYCEIKKNKIK